MKIVEQKDSIFVSKPEGTDVRYYIFPEYEIHYNEIKSGTTQPWHHHNIIEETIYIISGELKALWTDKDVKHFQTAKAGDIVRVENNPHTFVNESQDTVKFLVFRLILEGKDKRQQIKNDKQLDNIQ